jgi:diguanylate cyclase (GGDEF)-like protein
MAAPDSTHRLTRSASRSSTDGTAASVGTRQQTDPAWPDGWAGLLMLVVLLAAVMWSSLWLGSPGHSGPESVDAWPVIVNIAAASSLGAYAGLLMVRLRRKRAEVDAAQAQVREIAAYDELTGLWNRRHAQKAFQIELQRATRSKRPLCLALMDIDNLKQINDQNGHATGDVVLRAIALEAGQSLRDTDLLARWNGEEFLVLLPETTMVDALATLDRLRQRVDDAAIGGLTAHAVTVSIGVTLHGPDESLEATLDRANHALYVARAKGQNRVAST